MILYIISCFIALILVIYTMYKQFYSEGEDITLNMIMLCIIATLFSWVTIFAFIVVCLAKYNIIIIKGNKNK